MLAKKKFENMNPRVMFRASHFESEIIGFFNPLGLAILCMPVSNRNEDLAMVSPTDSSSSWQ